MTDILGAPHNALAQARTMAAPPFQDSINPPQFCLFANSCYLRTSSLAPLASHQAV